MAVRIPTLASVDKELAELEKRQAKLNDDRPKLVERLSEIVRKKGDLEPGVSWYHAYVDGKDVHPDSAGMVRVEHGMAPSEFQRAGWALQECDRELREIAEQLRHARHRASATAAERFKGDYRSEVVKLAKHLCGIFEPVAEYHSLLKQMEGQRIPALVAWPSDALGLEGAVRWMASAANSDLLDLRTLTPNVRKQVEATIRKDGYKAHWGE